METYTIFIYEADADFAARKDEKRGPAYWAAFAACGEQLKAAGVLRGGAALKSDALASTVEMRAGKRAVAAGAFAKSPIQLGGYFIDVPNLEAALVWAERAPNAATGLWKCGRSIRRAACDRDWQRAGVGLRFRTERGARSEPVSGKSRSFKNQNQKNSR